jgi:PAS domain S-box-containing protein
MSETPDAPGLQPPLDPFASRSRTRELVEQLPVVVFVDTDEYHGATVYISPNVEKVLGHPQASLLGDRGLWFRSIHPEDQDGFWRSWEDAWKRGTPFRAEYRLLRPDGEVVWIRESSVLVLSESGRRLAWQGVIEDLTAEKRSEEDVRASESRYRALVERVPAVVYEMDPDDERRTLYVSPHVEQVLGYSRAEWLDQPDIWIELLHADDREVVLAAHDRHSETGEPWDLEYRLIASDGRVVWVQDRATLIRGAGGTAAWHGVMIDITAEHDAREMLVLHKEDLERRVAERTSELQEANELMALEIGERRRMEEEVRQVEERYRRLVENMPGIAYTWEVHPGDEVRSFGYVSPRIQDVLGFSPEAWDASARIHPHDQARVADALDRSARTGESFLMEYRFLAKDGGVVWVLDNASLIARTRDGEPSAFQGVMLDITARKDAESKAKQAEDRFRELTEDGPVVAYSFELTYENGEWPPTLEMTYVSPQSADLVGYPVSYWLEDWRIWMEMIHPDDREFVMEDTERSWRTGQAWNLHYRVIRGDGAIIWLHDTGRMLQRNAAGRPWRFLGVLLDATENQEAKARLESSERNQRVALEGALAIPWSETIDPDTGFERYTYVGPQALDILGYTPEELMVDRKHFSRMVHPGDRARVRKTLIRSVQTGMWEDTYRIIRRDGDIRWLHSFGRRVSPPGASPEVWHGIAVDVTASRAEPKTEGATRQADALTERSAIVDPSGR